VNLGGTFSMVNLYSCKEMPSFALVLVLPVSSSLDAMVQGWIKNI